MTDWPLVLLIAIACYLVGSIPFGYMIARAHGVDIFREGSGNIGATNVARVVGKGWGLVVLLLDFTKGAGPVLAAWWLGGSASAGGSEAGSLPPDTLPVVAGVAAFLGHLFPVYLGFRGGKGVATGAGIIAVLVPLLTVFVLLAWAVVLFVTRYVSIASLSAAALLLGLRLALTPAPFDREHVVITAFCLVACVLVFLRHHSNIRRLIAGTEPRLGATDR